MSAPADLLARRLAFNINEHVRVKLNDKGRKALRASWDEMRAMYPKISPWRCPDEDAEGWSDWQLWSLMHELGPHISMGSQPPFDTTIEIVLPAAPPAPSPEAAPGALDRAFAAAHAESLAAPAPAVGDVKRLIAGLRGPYYAARPNLPREAADMIESQAAANAALSAQVERAFQVLESEGVPRTRARSVHGGIMVLAQRWNKYKHATEAANAALSAQVAALREDAERYRWLRDPQNADVSGYAASLWGKNMDEAIDSSRALAAEPQTKGEQRHSAESSTTTSMSKLDRDGR